ncbi:MAG: HIT family protein [Anaerolineales bacterium]
MKHIWSPWRMEYIQSNKKEEGCIFCKEIALSDGPGNLIVHRGRYNFVILNRFPYTSGHIMVVPYQHCSVLEDLKPETRSEMMELANQAVSLLQSEYRAEGFNIGINIGEAAGAGIAEHLHLHIVPRWEGDTNFISALGNTRVLPELLEDSYIRIAKGWKGVETAKDNH